MLSEQLLQSPFCIYGAGIVATSIYTAIKALYHKSPLFFLVSDSGEKRGGIFDDSPKEIDGIAVKRLSEWKRELKLSGNSVIVPQTYLVATPEEYHLTIIETLRSLELSEVFKGYKASVDEPRIISITNALENELLEKYYSILSNFPTVSELLSGSQSMEIDFVASVIRVFQAKSHMDKPLQQIGTIPNYIYPIQAGAALTEQSIADLKDNTGDNISPKNRNYCELTATYHTWKNSHAVYKGICHYRRIFDIDEKQMQTLLAMEHKWDVILPYPSVYYPNISKEHTRYVSGSDWNAMLQALRETAPEYLAAYEKAIADREQFFNNFNMLIAKAEIFDDYCNFLFTVLERTEQLTTPKGWERADRFAGYLGENLTTIYFLKNREKLKIAYAGETWLT